MGRALGNDPDRSFGVEVEVEGGENLYGLMGSNTWPDPQRKGVYFSCCLSLSLPYLFLAPLNFSSV